jgi:hypothetical protein
MKLPAFLGDASWSPVARMAWVFVGLVLLPVSGASALRTLPRLSGPPNRKCPRCDATPPVRKKMYACPRCGCVYDQRGNVFQESSWDPLKDLDLTRFNAKRASRNLDAKAVRRPERHQEPTP